MSSCQHRGKSDMQLRLQFTIIFIGNLSGDYFVKLFGLQVSENCEKCQCLQKAKIIYIWGI